ncbi:HEAT repeat domain-containing protein [Ktedonosporobacter rubrisoli]|nr:HEAT repeat domain-containing protein [Ktedonosporobacter rubrisoli]
MTQRKLSPYWLRSLLVGLGIAVILTFIVAVIILLLNPSGILGATANRFSALLTLPARAPQVLLLPLLVFLVASVGTLFTAQPLALIMYLREVHQAQEGYHKLYTPLTALTNLRQSAEEYQYNPTAPTTTVEEEQVSILDLVQQQDTHQLILGVPGAGKTTALRVYQYIASQRPLALAFARDRIPVYVPMKNYSLFLKGHQHQHSGRAEELAAGSLFAFLQESDLPGLRYLRSSVSHLAQQGRLLLLCDGLNEVDTNYLSAISEELVDLMRHTQNRLVMTCREVDYREQHDLIQLVNEGNALRAVIYPLQPEQVQEFVERYVERQDRTWQHTAGQIMQVIDRSRLRYHCTNPMMLFTLMGIIDKIGVERGKQIDTRGRLLREYVKQLIAYEQHQAKWHNRGPAEQDVVRFLGEVACAARWANDRNALQLRISSSRLAPGDNRVGRIDFDELADELRYWLDEHPAQGPFATEDEEELNGPYDDLPQLLQFALSAALVELSPRGVLSFRHELIAEYFVAEYFYAAARKSQASLLSIREELLEHVERWSEPVAIWAGLLDNPLALAERFGALGRSNPAYVLQALALALVCVGVLWTPPQAEQQRPIVLPTSVEEALAIAVRNRLARERLARIFTRCAEEGGQEVYRSLLPLIMVEGVDELLVLLDQNIVPELLFTHLQDAVDNVAYEAQVKRLTRILGRFGSIVIDRAVQLCQPLPERSLRLRAAAVNILGGTGEARAVEPLVARLRDTEPFIVERATNGLLRLGPTLTLMRIIQELENRSTDQLTQRVHRAVLIILGRFLEEQDVRRQVTIMQYQRILEAIVPVLTSNYQTEPEVQRQACEILIRQGRNTTESGMRDNRWEKVIEAIMRYLPSQNEVAAHNVMLVLQNIGTAVTPVLLEQLNQPSEVVRTRVVEILKHLRDTRALPRLLRLLSDTSPAVQHQSAQALRIYAPESIAGLLDLVLSAPNEMVAENAAKILSDIGEAVVVPIINVLFRVVPGRTRLLVQTLAYVHDPRAVPPLITLLQTPHIEPLLAVTIMRALSQFPEQRVVPPLLAVLSESNPQLYEEAIEALSQLGEIALNDLIEALDVEQETLVVQRVRRAILSMTPFPGEQLIRALATCNDQQMQQVMAIFKQQGMEAAQVLVRQLNHNDERIRNLVYQTLNELPGPIVVPALLEVLNLPSLRRVITTILLKYPESAISPLVELLGDQERGDVAAAILPLFGTRILRSLVSGLDDQRGMAREYAQRIMVTLVRQSNEPQNIARAIVHLFSPPLPPRAREVLLNVLTEELTDVCMPALLEGLEDAHLIGDVAEAFGRLVRKETLRQAALDNLLRALYSDERRRGAELALIKIGASAVPRVGELITDKNQLVAKAAKHVLREIGVPALSFILKAHSDRSYPARRMAAMEVFHSMDIEAIKDELISRLASESPDDISMAVSLLLERIHFEADQRSADSVMIPELVEYVQAHGVEETNLRIIALLLLVGEHITVDYIVQSLAANPQHRKQLTNMLLLLGEETQDVLLDVFNDGQTTVELRAEVAAVLSMVSAPKVVADAAQNVSSYGLAKTRTSVLFPEQLAISLRALGGLLASGHWNPRKLQELRDACEADSPALDLFNVLLGWRYEPQLAKLQSDLDAQKEAHKQEIVTLTARIVADQKRAQTLEEDLEKLQKEHGQRGDELKKAEQEKTTLRTNLEQLTKEKNTLKASLDQALKEKGALEARLKGAQSSQPAKPAGQQQAAQTKQQ